MVGTDTKTKFWTSVHSLGFFIITIIMLIAVRSTAFYDHPLIAYLSAVIFLVILLAVIGHGVTGCYRGALIDERNVISLSRFQMAAWTVIVLSAYLAGMFCNLAVENDDPLTIAIPAQLWILMGISTTSLVGSPLILGSKRVKKPSKKEMNKVIEELVLRGNTKESLTNIGMLAANSSPKKACWSDMFTGEETGNQAHLDLSRVQMLFFTLVVTIAYFIAVANMFIYSDSNGISTMPSLDESMLSLIAISHGGYLVAKGTTSSKEKSASKGSGVPETRKAKRGSSSSSRGNRKVTGVDKPTNEEDHK